MTDPSSTGARTDRSGTWVSSDARVRAAERHRLVLEIRDIVSHHLSNVSLRTMSRLDVADLTGVRTVLEDVSRAAGAALVELRLLAHLLEEDVVELDAVGELSRRSTPTAAAAEWRHRVIEAGGAAVYVVPEAADHLALSVQWTITRLFEVTAEAAVRPTGGSGRWTSDVEIASGRVTVVSATGLPSGATHHDDPGRHLVGLRERVDLMQGRFTAAVRVTARGSESVVTVTLPLD